LPTIDEILAIGGPLSQRLGDHYEPRPEQSVVAAAVARAMSENSVLLCEAGTGVGKSFAYLLPAMLRCMEGQTVVVATNTIALQEQLVRKDVPLLREILDPAATPNAELEDDESFATCKIRPILVKGRGNYVSVRRLRLASQRQDKLFADPAARRSLHVIEDWATTTMDGTLSTLPPLERPGVWDRVESDTGNCMGRKCPNHGICFYQRARRRMESANLLICNHALFFADLALRSQETGFLPRYDHVILDEAHNIEDVASEHFGESLSEGRVMHLLSTLYGERTGKGYLANLALLASDTQAVENAIRQVLGAAEASRAFFESALALLPSRSPMGLAGGVEPGTVRYRSGGLLDGRLAVAMSRLSLTLQTLRDVVRHEADQYELNAYAQRAQIVSEAASILVEQRLSGCAYWVEAGGESEISGGRIRRVTVACAPVEVAPLLREHLFKGEHSTILTSATLATRMKKSGELGEHAETAFAHAITRLGCDQLGDRPVRTVQVGSPFEYATQAELIIDTRADAKDPHRRSFGSADTATLAACVLEHVKETDGGAFVLFTSYASLHAVAGRLRPELQRLGMPLLAQGIDGSREDILRRFREDSRSVLLGAASFWQGVDVRGRGLRNVVIAKLPFDPPDRPLTEARSELIRQRGGSPFMEDAVPRAVIRFKQGFGRLIRSREDRGRVVVLDGRLVTSRYGRYFLEALPAGLPRRRIDAGLSEHESQIPF